MLSGPWGTSVSIWAHKGEMRTGCGAAPLDGCRQVRDTWESQEHRHRWKDGSRDGCREITEKDAETDTKIGTDGLETGTERGSH